MHSFFEPDTIPVRQPRSHSPHVMNEDIEAEQIVVLHSYLIWES